MLVCIQCEIYGKVMLISERVNFCLHIVQITENIVDNKKA